MGKKDCKRDPLAYRTLWEVMFPKKWRKKLIERHSLDQRAKKLFFFIFVCFLVTSIILGGGRLASRELEARTCQTKYQRLTGISPTRHSSICARLNTIPPAALDGLLTQAYQYTRARHRVKADTLPRMKAFDTTTWSVSRGHFEWAAKNGKRGAVRFTFVMDYKTGLPERIIDASVTTSDNTVFAEAISTTRPGTVWVFDRGFNRLETMKEVTERHGHFITRWSKSFSWRNISDRKLDSKAQLTKGWAIIRDEIGWVGSKKNKGRAQYRRITCRHPKTKKKFIILTNLRQARAAKLVRMYVLRWPIEVAFRHVKSSLGIIHFPVRSPQGVHNWLVLVALSLVFIELLPSSARSQARLNLMSPGYPFCDRWRETKTLIENEAFAGLVPAPCLSECSPGPLEEDSPLLLVETGLTVTC